MGNLELKAREYAPLIVLESREEPMTIDKIAGEPAVSEVEAALKNVRDGLDALISDKAREDLEPIVEQDIDPSVYESTDYAATVSYGNTTDVVYNYKGLKHDGTEANSKSYDLNVSAIEEGKLRERVHESHRAAQENQLMGRGASDAAFDMVQRNAKQEMALRSSPTFSFVQYALIGKVDFL